MTNDRSNHLILRQYIAWARDERFASLKYTDEKAAMDVLSATLQMAEITWLENVKLVRIIEHVRGLSPEQQFKRMIIRVPTWLQNRLMCLELVERFGLEKVQQVPGFARDGVLEIRQPSDFIFPVRTGYRIERFDFYTIREMKAWGTRPVKQPVRQTRDLVRDKKLDVPS